jgi:hypothetical protein
MIDSCDSQRFEEVGLELENVIAVMEEGWLTLSGGYCGEDEDGGGGDYDDEDSDEGEDSDEDDDEAGGGNVAPPPFKLALFLNKSDSPTSHSSDTVLDGLNHTEIFEGTEESVKQRRITRRKRETWISVFRGSVLKGEGLYEMFDFLGS